MRSSYIVTATAVVFACYTLAIPIDIYARTQLVARNPPDDWSSIPHDRKFPQPDDKKGRLKPQDGETGNDHITYKKDLAHHNVNQYQVWKPNPYEPGKSTDAGRWRGNEEAGGKTHAGIEPPIWHKGRDEKAQDKRLGNKDDSYQATDRQNPPAYRFSQFSAKLDKSGVMNHLPGNAQAHGKSKDDIGLGVKPHTHSGQSAPSNKAPLAPLPHLGAAVGGKHGSKTI